MPALRKNPPVSVAASDDMEAADLPGSSKRKRQASTHAEPVQTGRATPLKVTLTSPASMNGHPVSTVPKVMLSLSPTKGSVKRQKISLKVNGKAGRVEESVEEAEEGDDDEQVKTDEVGAQKDRVHALSRDVRDALALVLSQMAANLPRPINQVLTLFLPPSFEQKETNTLAHVLQQGDLTWERLVDLLHVFATHLLQPAAYPSPFPPLSHVHATIPPLPPHQPRHAIYDFCASLRELMLSIEPDRQSVTDIARLEKWALMMRVPIGTEGKGGGEWWTGVADWRVAEKAPKKEGEGDAPGLLGKLAEDGNAFGYAQAVSIASVAGPAGSTTAGPKLGESVIRRASLKAQRWKETLAKRKGGFGSFLRPVTVARTSALPWTPGFAPSFDSHYASGGVGYWSTLEAMHQRNRYGRLTSTGELEEDVEVAEGYFGTLEPKTAEGDTIDDVITAEHDSREGSGTEGVLSDNAAWLNELLGWQELRVRKGEAEVGKREQVVAEELLESLSRLAGSLPPSDLTPSAEPGFAHEMSKRLIKSSAPIVRGTLDPKRRQAMHDNTTIRSRPAVSQSATGVGSAPSIAQQLAGTPSRSSAPNPGYTPTNYQNHSVSSMPRQQPLPQSQQQYQQNNFGQQQQQYNQAPRQYGYPPAAQSTPTRPPGNYYGAQPASAGAYRPPYAFNHHQPSALPSQQNHQLPSGNTIYSRSPVSANIPLLPQQGPRLGSNSPSAGPGQMLQQQYQQQQQLNRPGLMGMQPSGLRQSFGPNGSGAAPGGSAAAGIGYGGMGGSGGGGYYS